MAFRLAELFVEIGARTGGLNAVLAGVHTRLLGMGPIGMKLSGAIHQATNAFLGLGALGPIALTGIVAGVGAATAGLVHCAFQAAHLQEAVAKVEQAFGTATPKVLAMADDLAKRFGVVRKEILDVAASFGLMLQGAGIQRELSADMSNMLSRLAVDAASYFDVEMSEAIMRLQSGLAGEAESVRRWGINLTESNVLRQAQAQGFNAKQSTDLSQETKTLIRYQILLKSTAAVHGDAERSQGRLIGQWKLLTGGLSELGTNIGQSVLPAVTGLIIGLNLLVMAINRTMGALNVTAGVSGGGGLAEKMARQMGYKPRERDDLKAIDERAAQTQKDMEADRAAAQQAEAATAKKRSDKGFQGGLEEWVKHLQQAAFGKDKDQVQKDQLAEQKAMKTLLEAIKAQLAKPTPAVVT